MLKKVLIGFALWMMFSAVLGQNKKTQWIDSVFNTLSTSEKVAQLLVVPVSSYSAEHHQEDLSDEIKDYQPGGIVILKGGPKGTANLINQLQNKSSIPLLVMMDAETGPGETLDSLINFPKPLSLGAIENDSLIYSLGAEIARELKLLGIHLNLGPNTSLNISEMSNPQNYFGSNKSVVSKKLITLTSGLQQNGIIATGKFSTSGAIPENSNTYYANSSWVDTTNFYPFNQLISSGVGAVSTSNFNFSISDNKKTQPAGPAASSKIFVNEILKKQLGFGGLIMTDMAGKSKNESEKMAFEAGHDLLIKPGNIKATIKKIETALKRNAALKLQLDNSVKKILGVKYDLGLQQSPQINTDNLLRKINTPAAEILNFELREASITIAKNKSQLIPIKILDGKKFAAINIGTGSTTSFNTYLSKYTAFDFYNIAAAEDTLQLNDLNNYDTVIVGVYAIDPSERDEIVRWLNNASRSNKIIICSFGNPNDLAGLLEPETLVMAYTDQMPVPMLTAQIIFGARQGRGTSPVSVNGLLAQGEGKANQTLDRLAYGLPELVGMSSETLEKISAVVAQAIDSGATPGCNVLVARNGQVVFDKSYGWKTYDKQEPVTWQTIYDLASITKVAATLQTVMFMQEKELIDVNKKVSVYLPEIKTTNKKNFTIKDILTHQAGLWPYLPYWLQTMQDSTLMPQYYSPQQNTEYPFPVSKDLFAVKTMRDSMWQWIINAKIREKKARTPYDYTYSDMGFYVMQQVAEKLLNQPLQDFVTQNLYEPLGATTTGFLPLERFPESQIAPTEVDKQFRHSKLVGYVHDQGAAMYGGVAGHAGLFSSANDLAKLAQMWLQKGSYGGQKFYKPETLDLFTARQYEISRRGLGWDKPTVSDWNGPTSLYASPKTFGHTGFTGTAVWVDPEFDLVYIFLSNRVYPDMFNTKLLTGNIRPRIQDIIYQSIFDYCKGQN